jgi:hypothetical protein
MSDITLNFQSSTLLGSILCITFPCAPIFIGVLAVQSVLAFSFAKSFQNSAAYPQLTTKDKAWKYFQIMAATIAPLFMPEFCFGLMLLLLTIFSIQGLMRGLPEVLESGKKLYQEYVKPQNNRGAVQLIN